MLLNAHAHAGEHHETREDHTVMRVALQLIIEDYTEASAVCRLKACPKLALRASWGE